MQAQIKKLIILLLTIGTLAIGAGDYGDGGDFDVADDILIINDENELVWYNWDTDFSYGGTDFNTVSIRASGSLEESYRGRMPINSGDPNSVLMTPGDIDSQWVWATFDANWIVEDGNEFTFPTKTPWNVMFVGSDGYPLTEDPNDFTYYQPETAFGIGMDNIAEGIYANNYIQVYYLLNFDPNLLNTSIGWARDDVLDGPNNVRIGDGAGGLLETSKENTLVGKDAGKPLVDVDDDTGVGYKVIGGETEAGEGGGGIPTLVPGDPYPGLPRTTPIYDIFDLNDVRDSPAGDYYLANDIDATATSAAEWDGGAGWLGMDFTGTLDGCGYTISNLFSSRDSQVITHGLFGTITGGTVANLTIQDASIIGGGLGDGALAGEVQTNTLIVNCKVLDAVMSSPTGTGPPNMSLFIGIIDDSNVVDCFARGTITTFNGSGGGFSGEITDANIVRCGVEGTFTFTSGQITAATGQAGFVEETTSSKFTDCYADVDIVISSGGSKTGGFVGDTLDLCTFTRCYSAGAVQQGSGFTGDDPEFPVWPTGGGYLGDHPSGGQDPTFTSCFWYTDLTGAIYPDGGSNEKHQLNIDGEATGGSFTITFDGDTTAPIAWDANNAIIQAACDAAFGVVFTIEKKFSGFVWQSGNAIYIHYDSTAYDRENLADNIITADISSLTGTSNLQEIVHTQGRAVYWPAGLTARTSDQGLPDDWDTDVWIFTGGVDRVAAFGAYAAARVTGGADDGLYLGTYSGAYNTIDPNRFFLDNLDRGDYPGNQQHGLMYGYMDVDPNKQWVDFNFDVNMPNHSIDVNDIAVEDVTISSLTASRLTASDANKKVVSTDIVNWIAGTTNRVSVADDGDGTATLSSPQDTDAGATPTFEGLIIAGATDLFLLNTGDLFLLNTGDRLMLNSTGLEDSVLYIGAAGLVSYDGNFIWDGSTFTVTGDIVLNTGALYLQEITTPTPKSGYGAIYPTSDNELFFQDGAGDEHLLHGDAFSNIWFHAPSSVEVTISTQGLFAKINSFTVVGHEDDIGNVIGSAATDNLTLSSASGGEYEISFHGSITATGGADKEMVMALGITLATPKDITNVTDDTVSPIVITSVGHGLENGDMVEIVGVLVNTAANGSFIVDNKANDTFVIVDLDGSATTGNGDYDEGTPTGDITILYPGNMEIHRMVRGADFGSVSATGVHLLAGDDVLAYYVANLSGVTNMTVSSVSFSVFRIGD